eukprot:7152851-Prymnesium_polylepis.2
MHTHWCGYPPASARSHSGPTTCGCAHQRDVSALTQTTVTVAQNKARASREKALPGRQDLTAPPLLEGPSWYSVRIAVIGLCVGFAAAPHLLEEGLLGVVVVAIVEVVQVTVVDVAIAVVVEHHVHAEAAFA